MADHGSRAHATWSASSTAANWACPGRLALVSSLALPDKESEAAAWGTACHQVSEKCLRSGKDADTLIGTTEKTKEHSFEVDEEMAETAQVYVDYVRSRADRHMCGLQVEQRFSLASLNPPFDAGGTADAVVYDPTEASLEVIDLKGGRGVLVEAKGNPQLRTYALGALLANPSYDVDRVRVTIVQPRAPHKDGRIRSETFHVIDLMEWTADLLEAMRRAARAQAEWGAAGVDADFVNRHAKEVLSDAEWRNTYLHAGPHCKFCPARGICPALERKALDTAGVWFDDLDQPKLANAPDTLDPEELSKRLDLLDMIEDWIKAVRADAHSRAESGIAIPNYILVDKEGREKWNDGADDTVIAAARAAGLAEDKYLNAPKLKTPKQVRKALGKAADTVAGLSDTPKGGTNLVRTDKTSRPAATPAANKHFSPID